MIEKCTVLHTGIHTTVPLNRIQNSFRLAGFLRCKIKLIARIRGGLSHTYVLHADVKNMQLEIEHTPRCISGAKKTTYIGTQIFKVKQDVPVHGNCTYIVKMRVKN